MIVIYAAPWRAEIKYLDFSVSFQIVTCLLAWILAAKIFILLLWPFSWLLFLFFYPQCSWQDQLLTLFSILCSLAVMVSSHSFSTKTINGMFLMTPPTDNASIPALLSIVVITIMSGQHTPVEHLTWKNSAKVKRMLDSWVTNQLDCQPHLTASKRWCDTVRKCLIGMLCWDFGHEVEQDLFLLFYLDSLGVAFLHKFILTSETSCTWIHQIVHLMSFPCF